MFCNHCGKGIEATQSFCGTCGAPLGQTQPPVAPRVSPATGRVTRNIKMLAMFWIVLSVLNLLRGGGRLIGARIVHYWGRNWFDDSGWGWPAGDILPAIISTMGLVTLCLAAAGFAAGFGLMERRPWARTVAIIVAIIALLNPILGTLLGIYTLWVLLPGEAEIEYRKMSGA